MNKCMSYPDRRNVDSLSSGMFHSRIAVCLKQTYLTQAVNFIMLCFSSSSLAALRVDEYLF